MGRNKVGGGASEVLETSQHVELHLASSRLTTWSCVHARTDGYPTTMLHTSPRYALLTADMTGDEA